MGSSRATCWPGLKLEAPTEWPSSRWKHICDGLLAILLYFFAQLLIWGTDSVISMTRRSFPGPIVAMLLVWGLMLIIGWCWSGLDGLFLRWLKGPVRHGEALSRGRGHG
jgi:hypothetical protein